MNNISIDFNNKTLCIMSEGQQSTEYIDIDIAAFYGFIPKHLRHYTSYTWDFEAETFAANQEVVLKDGAIMIRENFVPIFIAPMPGLKKRYKEFISILGYEEIETKSLFPEMFRRMFGIE